MTVNRPRIIGNAVLLLGLLAMYAWLFQPDLAMAIGRDAGYVVFNTAFCMLLSGIALNLLHVTSGKWAIVPRVLGAAIFLLATATVAEHVFDLNAGIDWNSLHQEIIEDTTPGRMSLMTSVSFMLIGMVIVLMHYVKSPASARLLQVLMLAAMLLGIIGIGSHFLQFEEIFGSDAFRFMSVPTAVAVMLTGFGLWRLQEHAVWFSKLPATSPDKHIFFNSLAILGLIAFITAFASFLSHQQALEKTLSDGLHLALSSRIKLINHEISLLEQDTETISTRSDLIGSLKSVNSNPLDATALARLKHDAFAEFKTGITAIAVLNAKDQVILKLGHFITSPDLSVTLRTSHKSRLLWNGLYRLNTRAEITDYDGHVGAIVIEQLAPITAAAVEDQIGLGRTGEVGLCAPLGTENRMNCFPLRFKPEAFTPPRVISGDPLPMDYALRGVSGTIKSRDYRHQLVIAAYAPVAYLGLGLVVKMDATELYEPIRAQLHFMLLLIILMVIAGALLLRLQIRPLTRRIVTSEQQLNLALESSQLALFDWDLRSGNVYLSGQWQLLLGGAEEPTHTNFHKLATQVHTEDFPELRKQLRLALKGIAPNYDVEHRVKNMAGQWIWIRSRGEVVERDSRGLALRITGTNADISDRKNVEFRLSHQATHDALTGLPNRILFHDRLSQAMTQSARNQSLMAVCYLDIDRFKSINDSLGHAVGDDLLKAFSERLLDCVRAVDTVARLGGDEFAVILSAVDSQDNACKVAEKIIQAMHPTFNIEQRRLITSTSLGIAFYAGEPDITADTLLKNADQALYDAKGAGRDNYQVAGGTPNAI